jgi:hypothetical protein
LEILPRQEESAGSSGGAVAAVGSAGEKRYEPLKIHIQEGAQEKFTEEESDNRRISYRNPVSCWIGRRHAGVKPLEERRENRYEPSDLEKIPVSRWIYGSCEGVKSSWIGGEISTRGGAIGISALGKSGFSRS